MTFDELKTSPTSIQELYAKTVIRLPINYSFLEKVKGDHPEFFEVQKKVKSPNQLKEEVDSIFQMFKRVDDDSSKGIASILSDEIKSTTSLPDIEVLRKEFVSYLGK